MQRLTLVMCLVGISCAKETPPQTPAPAAPPPAAASVAAPTVSAASGQNAELTAKYEEARKMIDSWRGDHSVLQNARKILFEVISKDKNFAPAYVGLARIEYRLGYESGETYDAEALRRARKFVDHALKLDPKLFEAYITSARVRYYEGDLDIARQVLDTAEQLKPGDASIDMVRMRIAKKERDYDEAQRLGESAISKTSDPEVLIEAYNQLVMLYDRKGDTARADHAYREHIRLEPQSAWAHGNYAAFLLRHRRNEEAVRHAEKAVSLMRYGLGLQTLAEAYVARADELWDAGRHDEAGALLEKLVTLGGAGPHQYYHLGVFYRAAATRTNRPDLLPKARAMFQKAVELDPSHESARIELARLNERVGTR